MTVARRRTANHPFQGRPHVVRDSRGKAALEQLGELLFLGGGALKRLDRELVPLGLLDPKLAVLVRRRAFRRSAAVRGATELIARARLVRVDTPAGRADAPLPV